MCEREKAIILILGFGFAQMGSGSYSENEQALHLSTVIFQNDFES